jgi:hypothetical protein
VVELGYIMMLSIESLVALSVAGQVEKSASWKSPRAPPPPPGEPNASRASSKISAKTSAACALSYPNPTSRGGCNALAAA